jgi:hypothetical protein
MCSTVVLCKLAIWVNATGLICADHLPLQCMSRMPETNALTLIQLLQLFLQVSKRVSPYKLNFTKQAAALTSAAMILPHSIAALLLLVLLAARHSGPCAPLVHHDR